MGRSGREFHAVPSGSVYWHLLAGWVRKDLRQYPIHHISAGFTLYPSYTTHSSHHRTPLVKHFLRLLSCSRFPLPASRSSLIAHRTVVIGTKTFHVLPPGAERFLDINPRPPHTNTSQIPISVSALFGSTSLPTAGHPAPPPEPELDAGTLSRYRAALAEAAKLPGACEASLGPGQSLLVPEGWWHSAEGIETGVGINAWFR